MKKILFILLFMLLVPLVSCSNQQNLSSKQSEVSNISESIADVFPTLNQIYSKNGYSALVSAKINQVYTDVLNVSDEIFIVIELSIEKDFFNCTQETLVYLPVAVEYLTLTENFERLSVNGKIDLTNEIEKMFLENTNIYVYLSNINYGNHASDYRNKKNSLSFENLFVANSINLVNYHNIFLMKNMALVKDDIPNLLIVNSILLEKKKNPFFDDTFYDGMSKDEIENIFSKI